jgi:DNA-directed RNA polymerase specialized sigma24 family protein
VNATLVADLDRRHRRRLVAYAAGAVGWADAEDVVQDALVSLLGARRPLHDDVGTVLVAVSHAVSHHRRYLLRECRDVRLTDRLGDAHAATIPDPACVEDAVCANAILLAFLRALTPGERRGLFRSVFVPGRIPKTDRALARNARVRLRALRAEAAG